MRSLEKSAEAQEPELTRRSGLESGRLREWCAHWKEGDMHRLGIMATKRKLPN